MKILKLINIKRLLKLKRKQRILLITGTLAILLPTVYFTFLNPKKAEAAWWDDNWHYRQKISFGNTGSALTNRKVKIDVDTATLITAGKLQSDCDDIRFTGINGNLLDYFIDTNEADCNTSSTDFYIKSDIIAGNQEVFMYYGNPSANNTRKNDFFADGTQGVGLKAYWKMNESSANTCANGTDDSCDSAHTNDGAWNDSTTNIAGKLGNAITLDGTGDYVDVGTMGSFGSQIGTSTFTAWVKTADTAAEQTAILKIIDSSGETFDVVYGIELNRYLTSGCSLAFDSSGYTLFYFRDNAGNVLARHITTNIFDNNWHHISWVVSDTSSNSMTVYVDGVSQTLNGSCSQSPSSFNNWTDNLVIGASNNRGVIEGYVDGEIDDARLYAKALSTPEIEYIYNSGNGREIDSPLTFSPTSGPTLDSEEVGEGPIAHWKFDEGGDNTCSGGTNDTCDSTTNTNDGAITGATWQTEDMCIVGKCLYFDGTDDYVDYTTGPTLSGASKATISAWVKVNDFASGTAAYTETTSSEGYTRIGLYVASDGRVQFTFRDSAGDPTGGATTVYSTNSLEKDKWYFISVVFDSVNDSHKVYINGNLDATDTTAVVALGTSTTTSAIVGGLDAVTDISNDFKGFIDEVKVYPYTRSAAEVKSDYIKFSGPHGSSAVLGAQDYSYLSNGLVGYWDTDETASPSVDSSGNQNNGTWNGTAADAAGKFGSSITLDGDSDYLTMANSSSLSPGAGDMTVATWVNTDMVDAAQHWIYSDYGSDTNNLVLLRLNSTDNFQVFFRDGSGNFADPESTSTISTDQWYHVVGVREGTTVKLYINGVEEASKTTSSLGTITTSDGVTPAIGRNHESAVSYWDGEIDEARVYNRALSTKEVLSLYDWAPGPVGYWPMDENTGTTTTYDRSGNGNDGTLTSMTESSWVPGKFGSALDFDGSADYANIGTGLNANFVRSKAYSVSAWIKTSATASNGHVVTNADWSSPYVGMGLIVESDGEVRLDINQTATKLIRIRTSATVNDGTWHHISTTYDGSGAAAGASIYIDGVKVSTTTDNDNTDADVTSSTNLEIGGRDAASGEMFDGFIDDVRIYNYDRAPSQVIEDMNAGHPIGGSPISSMMSYWKLDERQGTTANDSGFTTTNGIITGAVWKTEVDCKINGCLNFVASGEYVDASTMQVDSEDQDWTISAWSKITLDATGAKIIVAQRNSANNTAIEGQLYTAGDNGEPSCIVRDDSSNSAVATDSAHDAHDGNWHHFACKWNNSSSTVTLYYDGVQVATDTDATVGTITSDRFRIGNSAGLAQFAYDGQIDEVKVYNTALTADQILIDMNAGSSAAMGGVLGSSEASDLSGGAGNAPVAEFKLDEGTGTSTYDTSENSNTGTLGGGTADYRPTWSRGKNGNALNFDGSNDYVSMDDDTSLDITSALTLEAWIKRANPSSTAGENIIVKDTNSYQMYISNKQLTFAKAGDIVIASSTTSITDSDWHHVVVTWNGTTAKQYIDGIDVSGTTTAATLTNSGLALGIGLRLSNSASPFNGHIDQARIFNYVRTPAQIAYNFNRGAPVGWWKLDECQGSTAYDKSQDANGDTNGNTGAIGIGASAPNTSLGTCSSGTGTEAWNNGTTGKINYSLDLDGADDSVTITNANEIDFDTSLKNGVTFASWIYANSDGESDTGEIFDKGSATFCRTDSESGGSLDLQCSLDLDSGGSDATLNISSPLSTNTWHHVAMTYSDDGDDEIIVYVDGVSRGTSTDGSGAPQSTDTNDLIIGGDSSNNFDGQIDDFRIYNYELSVAQIKKVMNNTPQRFGPATGAP